MRNTLVGLSAATLFVTAAPSFAGSAALTMLDDLATDVTIDSLGITLVIANGGEALIYSSADGFSSPTSIGVGSGAAISAEGTAVAGQAEIDGQSQAARWTESGGWEGLGNLGATGGGSCQQSNAYGISADGSAAVGLAWADLCSSRGFIWTSATGIEGLDTTAAGSSGYRANAISADGSTIAGWAPNRTPIVWNADGSVAFNDADMPGEFWGMTPDGTTMVGGGQAGPALYWNACEGFVPIGTLNKDANATAFDISADGRRIVGSSGAFFEGPEAFLWSEQTGIVNLQQYLADLGVTIPVGVIFTSAEGITDDGKTVVGVAVGGGFRGFVATLPDLEPDPCPADFDDDGSVGFSDLTRLLALWGPCLCPTACPEDLDLDGRGQVGFADLTTLLSAWGPCS